MSRIFLSLQLFMIVQMSSSRAVDPEGHNKPLGSHFSPLGVTMVGKFSSPSVFYEHFVRDSNPLWMKSPLIDNPFPAFMKWNDDYMRTKFGSEIVTVEQSKKEKRGLKPARMTLNEYLDIYKTENVYMVQSILESMKSDVHLPVTLQCGGAQRVLQDVVVWMSSGDTKSVLHRDKLDNLLCVFNGTKNVLLIDQKYKADVEADGWVEEGMYSKIDVDSVNLKQYPRMKHVPWHRAHLTEGDCVYIPYGWYHQVNSTGGEWNRNLAVNFWFAHLWWHNSSDCDNFMSLNVTEPLTKFPFASPNEQIRSHILEPFSEMETVSEEEFVAAFLADSSQVKELYWFINAEDKKSLTWKDLYKFDIDEAVTKFPEVFAKGVKLPEVRKQRIHLEPIKIEGDFEGDENIIKVPMIDPSSEEFEKILETVVKSGEFIDTREKPDSKLKINDINVKVTKGKQSDSESKDHKKTSTPKPKHDEF